MFCWVFKVLALDKRYKGRASRKSLKLSCYNNPHAFSPPLPLTELSIQLIPMTEAELAPHHRWEREVLTFCSCHLLTKAGFDSHLIPQSADWNNKRAAKYSGDFFSPVSELNHPTVKSGASRQAGGAGREGTRNLPLCSSKDLAGLAVLCCELTLDHSCGAASPGCFLTMGTSLHLLSPYSHLFFYSIANFPLFLS